MRLILPFTLICFLFSRNGFAQQSDSTRALHGQLDVGGWVATTGTLPFWLQTNQWGTAPRSAPAATVRAAVWKDYARVDSLTKHRHWLDWGFGVNPVVNAAHPAQGLLPEAYVKIKLGALELLAGRRRQLIGLGDSTLSSGFIAQSDNALPIPKIQLATRGYVPIGFLKKKVAINAGYNHGWFNVPYIQQSYLHQKYLYVRFGKPTAAVKVHLGLNHQVQWGGHAQYLRDDPNLAVNGQLPASLKYYPYIVFAINPGQWATADYTSFDGAYRIGNHVGSVDGAVEVRSGVGNWLLYHQHIYEDVSSLLFLNAPDGLSGLSWARLAGRSGRAVISVQRIVAEFLTTLDQSGPTFDLPNKWYQGDDNYYNHGQYKEGWSYLGRGLGTPFIAPNAELVPPARGGVFFPNNRVQAWYVGATGLFANRLTWTTRLAFSRNYGTFSQPYASPLNQFSGLLTAQLPLRRWPGTYLTTSVAVDQGQLRPNGVGGYLGLRRRW